MAHSRRGTTNGRSSPVFIGRSDGVCRGDACDATSSRHLTLIVEQHLQLTLHVVLIQSVWTTR